MLPTLTDQMTFFLEIQRQPKKLHYVKDLKIN